MTYLLGGFKSRGRVSARFAQQAQALYHILLFLGAASPSIDRLGHYISVPVQRHFAAETLKPPGVGLTGVFT